MNDPWGFDSLDKEQQVDLLAYWQIQKKDTPARWMLSNPVSLRDLFDILLTSRGKPPRSLFKQKNNVDGNLVRKWSEKTGSSPQAIRWLLGDEG